MQEFTVKILLRSQKGESRGTVHLRPIPREEAVRKGVIAWLSAWGVALLTLPIPIVHFVAPPLLLLFGPVVGFAIYKLYVGGVDLTHGEAACPDCETNIQIGPRAERWPLDLVCSSCEARLSAVRI